MDYFKSLQEIGLTKTQAKIYLALLKMGEATVLELSRKTKISRTTLYSNLEKMSKQGLVKEMLFKNSSKYLLEDLGQLSVIIDNNKIKAHQVTSELSKVFEQGKKDTIIQVFEPSKLFFEKLWSKNINNTTKEVREFGLYDSWRHYVINTVGKKVHKKYMSEWEKRSVKIRSLISIKDSESFFNDPQYPPSYYKADFSVLEMRVYPKVLHFNIDIQVVGSQNVVFTMPPSENFGFSINSNSVSKTFGMFFDFLWVDSKRNDLLYSKYNM